MREIKEIEIIKLLNEISENHVVPKKVKYQNHIYTFDEERKTYYDEDDKQFFETYSFKILNDKVEIIEENDEWEEIHTIKFTRGEKFVIESRYSIKKAFNLVCDNQEKLIIVMNKIIKNQKYLKERLDKNEK